jgi:hypothetical protein
MSARRQRTRPSEADTIVSSPPVHMRRWASRPRVVELSARASRRLGRLGRLLRGRAGAWLVAANAWVAAGLETAEAGLSRLVLVRRRTVALRALGKAAYEDDAAEVERARVQVETIDGQIARSSARAASARAVAAHRSRSALASARATEIHRS